MAVRLLRQLALRPGRAAAQAGRCHPLRPHLHTPVQLGRLVNPQYTRSLHPASPSTTGKAPFFEFGSLASYASCDSTPHIGTHFPSPSAISSPRPQLHLADVLTAPNSDELIRDLATLVSHRGVVFFSKQQLVIGQQKELAKRMGQLSWNLPREKTSGLHIHPVSEETPELGADTSVIDSKEGIARADYRQNVRASAGWHADITFENIPSDYSILKLHTLPPIGGDTLWASGYEAYDRLSPAYRRFLEGLTAVHNADFFNEYAQQAGIKIQTTRGAPENVGEDLTAVHPVIRTNPVTGFKALFVNRNFTRRIVELEEDESESVLDYLFRHVAENHDLQVRFKWEKDDVAIWDNRCTLHTATNDYGDAARQGNRVVSLGERPYLDPASKSRREFLEANKAASNGA
ncbi:hypothetical protein BOTBODRAFT_120633 [Botryobasidium botryosum FD-172 SS1]|uniref:TauD/TfdA-like domain-containing protein n=1 Tax=Botryobasidium botryosum (strain FD-172 SS1) TaxID=930990 RepID=A0A067LXG6_BOTB1|nr:hypothetical protein BOTBODRAFT_120633 [Botryobasidium botryosum FD-172 SS1]